jgi:hypothetical protein
VRALHNSFVYPFAFPVFPLGFSVANLQLLKANILILLIILLDKCFLFRHNSFKLNLLEELWASKT